MSCLKLNHEIVTLNHKIIREQSFHQLEKINENTYPKL